MKGQSVLFSSAKTGGSDSWETPPFLFNWLNSNFKFARDIAASDKNHLLPEYFTEQNDALREDLSWGKDGENVFCNPPYSLTSKFLEKAWFEHWSVNTVFLIPARVDTKVWHEWICPFASKVWFIKGRLHFYKDGEPAPHPCGMPLMIVNLGYVPVGGRPDRDSYPKPVPQNNAFSHHMPIIQNLDVSKLPGYTEYRNCVKQVRLDLGI